MHKLIVFSTEHHDDDSALFFQPYCCLVFFRSLIKKKQAQGNWAPAKMEGARGWMISPPPHPTPSYIALRASYSLSLACSFASKNREAVNLLKSGGKIFVLSEACPEHHKYRLISL